MLTKFPLLSALLICSAVPRVALAQNPPPAKTQTPPPPKTENFWHKVLRVSGIAASPSTLKGPGDEVQRGQIWIVAVHSGKPRKLTTTGGYRSPVFLTDGAAILALQGSSVMRISLADGSATTLFSVPGVTKLIGFSLDDSNALLVLTRDAQNHPAVAFLDVRTGKLAPLPYDSSSTDDRHMLEHLSAWNRTYGDTLLYVSQQTKSGMAGTLSWLDVFLKQGTQAAVDVSNCDGTNCGQPSLSVDGQFVAFVRSDQD